MYRKFLNMFVFSNISKFLLIVFCITLSLTGFLISDNLGKNTQKLIANDAKPVLGGDIKISSNSKLNKDQTLYLSNLQKDKKIILSEKIETYTTITDKNNNPSSVLLTFIDEHYPLYGNFEIEKSPPHLRGIKGEYAFITENIKDSFLQNGFIEIYGKKYPVGGVVKQAPGLGFSFFNDGRKLWLTLKEFDNLEIQKFGARIDRDYLIKVLNPSDFEEILSNMKESPVWEKVRIRDYNGGAERFENIFFELEKFLKYISIISFIITILIIFLSVESFYISNKKNFSVLRILGLKNINLIFFNIFLFIFLLFVSVLFSFILAEFVFSIIRNFELSSNFYLDYFSVFKAFVLGLIILFLSIVLPLFKFLLSDPLSGLKENFLQVYSRKEIYIELFLIFIGIIIIYSLIIGNLLSGFYFTLILFLAVFVISAFLKFILFTIYKSSYFLKSKNFSIFDAIRNTIKPGNLSLLISFSFIISFTSILFISIISLNFMDKLNVDINNNENIYVINLNKNDIENIDSKYKNASYSLISGRILKINNKSLKEHIGDSGRFSREFNITDNSLDDIKILKGSKIKTGEVSIDNDFAKALKVGIGDEIEFLVYGINKKLVISNIRQGAGGSIRPFFYFQVFPADFKNFPKKYFLSTYVKEENLKSFKSDFLDKTGVHISFIELDKVIKEVKSISTKVFLVIQTLFIYVFVFCVISLIVSVLFLVPFKQNKFSIYSTLGASRKFINKNNLFEYVYLQSLSFILSISISTLLSYFILSSSEFIDFNFGSYLLSILFLIIIFVFLLLLILFSSKSNFKSSK